MKALGHVFVMAAVVGSLSYVLQTVITKPHHNIQQIIAATAMCYMAGAIHATIMALVARRRSRKLIER